MKSLLVLAFLSGVGVLCAQSARDSAPEPRFSELSLQDSERLGQQRALVAAVRQKEIRHSSAEQDEKRLADSTAPNHRQGLQ